jgi:hypothetical protein
VFNVDVDGDLVADGDDEPYTFALFEQSLKKHETPRNPQTISRKNRTAAGRGKSRATILGPGMALSRGSVLSTHFRRDRQLL